MKISSLPNSSYSLSQRPAVKASFVGGPSDSFTFSRRGKGKVIAGLSVAGGAALGGYLAGSATKNLTGLGAKMLGGASGLVVGGAVAGIAGGILASVLSDSEGFGDLAAGYGGLLIGGALGAIGGGIGGFMLGTGGGNVLGYAAGAMAGAVVGGFAAKGFLSN